MKNVEGLLLAIAEVCEDEDGNLLDITLEDIESLLTDEESDLYPMAHSVSSSLYNGFLYGLDLFTRISEGKNVTFTSYDIVSYIVGYLNSIYRPEHAVIDVLSEKSNIYRYALENQSSFRFLYDRLLSEEDFMDEDRKYYLRQKKVDNFIKRNLMC